MNPWGPAAGRPPPLRPGTHTPNPGATLVAGLSVAPQPLHLTSVRPLEEAGPDAIPAL
jgi:hypothetical protein